MTDRVLVTGAGGKTGRAVMAALRAREVGVRAFVRDPDRHADLRTSGDVEVVAGDQRDVGDLDAALTGCAAVYAIAPNVTPHEQHMGRAVIDACQRHPGVRLVYHSVLDPFEPAMPHHADKGEVEQLIAASGLPATILRPNAYLQNLDSYLEELRAGRYRVPYAVDQGLAMVDLREVAEIAARALTGDPTLSAVGAAGAAGADAAGRADRALGAVADDAPLVLELAGPAPVTPTDVAAVAAELLGSPVHAERQDPDAWLRANEHLPAEARRRLHAMFAFYDHHGFPGDPALLARLLERTPTGLREYLNERLAAR